MDDWTEPATAEQLAEITELSPLAGIYTEKQTLDYGEATVLIRRLQPIECYGHYNARRHKCLAKQDWYFNCQSCKKEGFN